MAYVDALSELEDFADGSKPWLDLVFSVSDFQVAKRNDGKIERRWLVGKAFGLANEKLIGLGFEIPLEGWRLNSNYVPGDLKVHWGQINLTSVGDATDSLLKLYSEWFERPIRSMRAASRLECGAVSLQNGFPQPMEHLTHFKLFFEDRNEDVDQEGMTSPERYAEQFFNIDINARRIWLREKDPEYRLTLLKFMTQELHSMPTISLGQLLN